MCEETTEQDSEKKLNTIIIDNDDSVPYQSNSVQNEISNIGNSSANNEQTDSYVNTPEENKNQVTLVDSKIEKKKCKACENKLKHTENSEQHDVQNGCDNVHEKMDENSNEKSIEQCENQESLEVEAVRMGSMNHHQHQHEQTNAQTTTTPAATVTETKTSSSSTDGAPSAFENTNAAIEMILVNASLETVAVENDNSRLPDVVVETKLQYENDNVQTTETYFSIAIQVFIPFLIAGFGMVGAGLVLDLVQHWSVFEDITELVILVPALLGLKGNLEMTLASRLSTQANLGHMDTPKQQWSMIVGNLTLIQCQAIVVGFLGSVIAIVMGGIKSNDVELDHAYLLCASSLVTVSLASFVLGLITAGVIILSRHCHINPDNVATPIAASLGDITSLALLSWIATVLYESIGTQDWLAPLIISGYILIIPLWIWIAKKNQHTRDVLYNGWTPVMAAMLISCMGGLILDFMVSRFENIAVFQPVINGVGGNLVAVQASRISTALHKSAELGILTSDSETDEDTVIFISPVTGFCGKGTHARTTRVLMAMVVPGHLIFIYTISYMKAGHTNLTTLFVIVYLCAAMLQVAALMYIAYIMIHWMWKKKIDPDNSAIPYLTSMGDLLGISLLAIAFQFLYLVGDHESDDRSGE